MDNASRPVLQVLCAEALRARRCAHPTKAAFHDCCRFASLGTVVAVASLLRLGIFYMISTHRQTAADRKHTAFCDSEEMLLFKVDPRSGFDFRS